MKSVLEQIDEHRVITYLLILILYSFKHNISLNCYEMRLCFCYIYIYMYIWEIHDKYYFVKLLLYSVKIVHKLAGNLVSKVQNVSKKY